MSFPGESGNEQDHRSERIVHRRARSKIREKQEKPGATDIMSHMNDLPHFY
jgi:hypothetical protein